jgi:hypothetical protein
LEGQFADSGDQKVRPEDPDVVHGPDIILLATK